MKRKWSFLDINEVEERKWEDLEKVCLVNVFRWVPIESVLFDVPFVCKSWYKASLDPSCWERPVVPEVQLVEIGWNDILIKKRIRDEYKREGVSVVKFIVERSLGNCTMLDLTGCSLDFVNFVAQKCPALRLIYLLNYLEVGDFLPEVIGKWKYLEYLGLYSPYNLVGILSRISCKSFSGLYIGGGDIQEEEALAIVTYIPKIKYLILKVCMDRRSLVTILQGCKELVHLDLCNHVDLEIDDDILELASNIAKFVYVNDSSLWASDDDVTDLFD